MKRVLITGANRGIGLEFVRQYAGRGDRVFAAARKPAEAAELRQITDASGDRVTLVTLDTGDEASILAAYEDVRGQTDTLDVLVNNAGIGNGGSFETSEKFGTLRMEAMLNVLRVNAAGPALIAQTFLPLVQAAGPNGIVAGVTSGLGSLERTRDMAFAISYSASKAALNMYLRSIAFTEDVGVLTVALDPGWVRTDMGGPNAHLSPEESVSGMIRVLDNLTPDQTGTFLAYDGSVTPW
jgi:NAD(P)-dependent dehydrogenase (short-subunit alcohol dehydrogenase family)